MDSNMSTRSSFQRSETPVSFQENTRGSFRREPPVVPERVAVLKANYKQAWFFFLIGVCLVFAWGGVIRYALIRAFAFGDKEDIPRTSSTFVAIAYEGISESEKEVTPQRFLDQVNTLEAAGYNAITLEDIRSFYEDGTLLPEKAILLTFDHSRKSSYFDARKVLQRLGWRAVMFIWTKPILDEDPSALRWPYVRAMIGSGAWEAGAQSHLGFERIQADSEGRLQNFLTSPKWLSAENRFESPQEFKARLQQDHQFVYDLITDETKKQPIAFAFPYGDFGQYDERALLTRRLNMDLVEEYYDLAFILGNAALNTRYTNPLRLNRLLVDPEWDGEELLSRLEASWPKSLGTDSGRLLSEKKLWQHDWGEFDLVDDKAVLQASDDNTGAKTWINGTDLYQDFSARVVLNIERGQAGVFLRASKDGESHLYLGLGDQGEVWLRQKTPGLESFTLGTSRYQPEPDGSVVLEVYLRGNQFFASTAGQPVFQEIILTREEVVPGLIGLSVWDPEVGAAKLEVLELEMEPFHNRLVTWEPMISRQPTLAGWMSRNGYRYNLLSAPWLHLGDLGRAEQLGWDPAYYSDMANVYNMRFAPEIIVTRLDSMDTSMARNLAERAANAGADAVYCNLSRMPASLNISLVTSWLENISTALTEKEIELIVSLPPSLNQANTINSLMQGLANLQIAMKPEQMSRMQGIDRSDARLVSWNHESLERTAHPLFFQLTGGDADEELWSNEVRSRFLWEQGFEAFNRGDFNTAIEIWTRWETIEPYNESPPRLIGDVHRTLQNYAEAVRFYQKSLELNPGQLPLVVTTAKLLSDFLSDTSGAINLLETYLTIFPENSELSLTQAELLMAAGEKDNAIAMMETIVRENPEDLNALALIHPLLPTRMDRIRNMEKIRAVGAKIGMYKHFADAIAGHGLLVYPESWRLMDLVEERAREDRPESELYRSMLPRDTVAREKFFVGDLSDEWIVGGGNRPVSEIEMDEYKLQASPTSGEAALRLRDSTLMSNGFVEAELENTRGFFWLYARRSEGNMVRFGFEQTGKLFLQIWQDNVIVVNMSRDWIHPVGSFNMRLEIRGDAAYAYLNGKPAFGFPARVPKELNLGWWGLAPWAPQFGIAQATLREIAGGPLPVNIGILNPRDKAVNDAELVSKIIENTNSLSIFSPPWFFQDGAGKVRSAMEEEYNKSRLLLRYHKIKLYPLILSASPNALDLEELVRLGTSAKVDGFALSFAALPPDSWFEEADRVLRAHDLGMIAMRINLADGYIPVRQVAGEKNLLPGSRKAVNFDIVDLSEISPPFFRLEETAKNFSQANEPAEEHAEAEPQVNGVKPSVVFPLAPNTVVVF